MTASLQAQTHTPSSQHTTPSIYFDAPEYINTMAVSQDTVPSPPAADHIHMPQPQPHSSSPTKYQLQDDGPVYERPETHYYSTYEATQHPNGSEGWLPAVGDDVKHSRSPTRLVKPHAREGSVSPSNRVQDRDFAVVGGYHVNGNGYTNGNGSVHSRTASPSPRLGTVGLARRATTGTALTRSGSRRSKSSHTASDGRTIPGSAFVNGAGATGPSATALDDEELRVRVQEATANLTPKQKSKIMKDEIKQGKRLSKIIKKEAKTEKQALAIAIEELAELQKFQKSAVKNEARVHTNHTKLLQTFKKTEAAYLTAKMRYDTALAQLNSDTEALETLRNSAREATERMQDKAAEVDSLRATLAVDEREREVKLAQLKGANIKRNSSIFGN